MSKVDNVFDSWEEMDESVLNTQINQIKRDMQTASASSSNNSNQIPSQNGGVPYMIMMRTDEEYGSSYVPQAKPAVKILRRPTTATSETKISDIKPRQPIKTLQQRELEYAEARLRILGSAKNPEDELELSTPKVSIKPLDVVNNDGLPLQQQQLLRNTGDRFSNNINSTLLNGQARPNDNILRMPRGPDGTIGFNIRR